MTQLDDAQIQKLNAERSLFETKQRELEIEIRDRESAYLHEQASAEENNIFAFYFSISTQSTGMCMQTIGHWARRQEAEGGEKKPFTIELCSPGGNVVAGFALIDYIREIQAQGFEVNTLGLGLVASMAAVVLQTGTRRILGKNSYLMIHELQADFEGSVAEFQDQERIMRRLNDHNYEILADRSNLTKQTIQRRARKQDWWLNAEEALKAGFVDEVH